MSMQLPIACPHNTYVEHLSERNPLFNNLKKGKPDYSNGEMTRELLR